MLCAVVTVLTTRAPASMMGRRFEIRVVCCGMGAHPASYDRFVRFLARLIRIKLLTLRVPLCHAAFVLHLALFGVHDDIAWMTDPWDPSSLLVQFHFGLSERRLDTHCGNGTEHLLGAL